MRERQVAVVSRQGDAVVTTEILPDASFEQRCRELRGTVPDIGPVQARVLSVSCNRCGARAELNLDRPQLPPGWITNDEGEFCPSCLT